MKKTGRTVPGCWFQVNNVLCAPGGSHASFFSRCRMASCMGLLFAVLLCVGGLPACALDPGINSTHIVVGQSAAFSGLQADYGIRLAAGIRVAFEEANAVGGIQPRWPTTYKR